MGKTKIKTIDDSVPQKTKGKTSKAKGRMQEEIKAEAAKEALKAKLTGESVTKISIERPTKVAQTSKEEKKVVQKPTPQPAKQKSRGKKYQKALKDTQINKSQFYPLEQAVEMAQKSSYTKFVGTIEAHINTNQKNIRGLVTLPHMSGRQLRVLVFAPASTTLKEEDKEGVTFGDENALLEIEKGKVKFDVVVATPEWMPKLAKVAKVLGPKGLMPNPKNNTVTDNIAKAVADLKGGKTEYKTESNGKIIHLVAGKADQPKEEIAANIKVLFSTLGKSKASKITLSPTMGPGIKVDLSTI